ncbi:MAG: hypothetical protein M0Q21_02960 [Ignavibacteriaceae bacterium]|nr:hypothetical protein [Ignavibacteriaceae bacterium]
MKELSEYINQPLRFKQVSFFKRYYELKTTEEVIGSMQIRGFFGNSAEVSFANKKWEIYKPSIWKSGWAIREAGYENPFAHFDRKFFRKASVVLLPVGEKAQVVFSPFRAKIEIQTEDGTCLIKMVNKFAWTDSSEVIVTAKSAIVNKYPWLIMLAKLSAIERKRSHVATVPIMFGGF